MPNVRHPAIGRPRHAEHPTQLLRTANLARYVSLLGLNLVVRVQVQLKTYDPRSSSRTTVQVDHRLRRKSPLARTEPFKRLTYYVLEMVMLLVEAGELAFLSPASRRSTDPTSAFQGLSSVSTRPRVGSVRAPSLITDGHTYTLSLAIRCNLFRVSFPSHVSQF